MILPIIELHLTIRTHKGTHNIRHNKTINNTTKTSFNTKSESHTFNRHKKNFTSKGQLAVDNNTPSSHTIRTMCTSQVAAQHWPAYKSLPCPLHSRQTDHRGAKKTIWRALWRQVTDHLPARREDKRYLRSGPDSELIGRNRLLGFVTICWFWYCNLIIIYLN